MEKNHKEMNEYRKQLIYPGYAVTVVGLLLFIFLQGTYWIVVGIVLFFVGIWLFVGGKSEIKRIKYEMKEQFISEQAKELFGGKFTQLGYQLDDDYRKFGIPLYGDSIIASHIVQGNYRDVGFKFHDLDMSSTKYIRGDESSGSRTETKKIFAGIAVIASVQEESDEFIVISPKKKKKKYSYDGSSKYFYKHFKVSSSSKEYEERFINVQFLEAFFGSITKYGRMYFAKKGGEYCILLEHKQLFNFLEIKDSIHENFEYEMNIPKDIINNIIL